MPNLRSYKQQLIDNHHRGVVVISGCWQYCLDQLPAAENTSWWLGDDAPETFHAVSNKQAQQILGQECQTLVINGHKGIDLNALGAITGCLTAGEICYLITPPLEQWSLQPDSQQTRFNAYSENPAPQSNYTVQHLVNVIKQNTQIALISQQNSRTPALKRLTVSNKQPDGQCKTTEQQQAVEKILKVVSGHRNRPLVLTADRGRGKSSALGIAAAQLIKMGKKDIIITAPNIHSVTPVFSMVQAAGINTDTSTNKAAIRFIAIDQLIATKPAAILVMIDEAAAIPAPLLTELLSHYSRLVFTSTIAGYEGTGRGFEIRFKAKLNQLTPNWHSFHMLEPIRFAQDDILENFVNQALMLKAKTANVSEITNSASLKQWHSQQLIQQPNILSQLFALLTLAHYKTSPNDLRHLLDGNNIAVFSFGEQEHIQAVALIAIEGKINSDLAAAISQGRRRVKGHLIPQSLNYHCGSTDATDLSYARIIRIAVHPDIQQQNIGSQFLVALEQHYQNQAIDFIGASFGANKALIDFWQKNHYIPVRLGQTLEATSNEYSVIVLKALKNPLTKHNQLQAQTQAQVQLQQYQQAFNQQLPHQLIEQCEKLSAEVIIQLFTHFKPAKALTTQQQQRLTNYLHHQLDYQYCIPELYQWLQYTLATTPEQITKLPTIEQSILIDKVIRKQSWSQLCQTYHISGKKLAAKQLKQIINSTNIS